MFLLTRIGKFWATWEVFWHHHDSHMEADSETSTELDCQMAALTEDSKNGCLTSPPPSKISLTKPWTMLLGACKDNLKFLGYQLKAAISRNFSGRQRLSLKITWVIPSCGWEMQKDHSRQEGVWHSGQRLAFGRKSSSSPVVLHFSRTQ